MVVPTDDVALDALERYRFDGGSKSLLRILRRYVVMLYDNRFEQLRSMGCLGEAGGVYYVLPEFVASVYSSERGLDVEQDALRIYDFGKNRKR